MFCYSLFFSGTPPLSIHFVNHRRECLFKLNWTVHPLICHTSLSSRRFTSFGETGLYAATALELRRSNAIERDLTNPRTTSSSFSKFNQEVDHLIWRFVARAHRMWIRGAHRASSFAFRFHLVFGSISNVYCTDLRLSMNFLIPIGMSNLCTQYESLKC